MADVVTAYVAMVYIVMAYVVMAYIATADVVSDGVPQSNGQNRGPVHIVIALYTYGLYSYCPIYLWST